MFSTSCVQKSHGNPLNQNQRKQRPQLGNLRTVRAQAVNPEGPKEKERQTLCSSPKSFFPALPLCSTLLRPSLSASSRLNQRTTVLRSWETKEREELPCGEAMVTKPARNRADEVRLLPLYRSKKGPPNTEPLK